MIGMRQQVQEATFTRDYQGLAAQLPCELRYVVVYPFENHKKGQEIQNGHKIRPTILTYRDDEMTFEELMTQLSKKRRFHVAVNRLRFTLSKGFKIPMKKPINYLQRKLGKENLDGLQIYIVESRESLQEELIRTGETIDECALMDFISQTNCVVNTKMTIHFQLPNSSYVISIDSSLQESITDLKAKFFAELKKQLDLTLSSSDIKGFYVNQKMIPEKGIIENVPLLKNNCYVKLLMKNPAIKFLFRAKEDDHMITLKGSFFKSNDKSIGSKTIKRNYRQLRCMQISKIYENYFLQKNERSNKQNPVCLKVLEIILKPQQRLSKLDGVIEKLKQLGNVKLVGNFINQKVIFYKEIPDLTKEGASVFSLEELEIPEEQSSNRQNCNEKMSERLKSLINQENLSYFKQKQRLQPIFIYTTNLMIKEGKDSQPAPIYSLLNKHLREQKFLYKTKEDLQSWYLRYASTLIEHLKIIKNQQLKLFRGSSFDPLARVGQFLTFKSFTSTTSKIQVALKFAINTAQQNYMNKTKQEELDLNFYEKLQIVMFEMEVKSAKKIDGLSYFQSEEEYLMEPYCEFLVEKVQRKKYEQAPLYTFTVYTLREIDTNRQMPQYTNNYIVWIDDKMSQGSIIFNQFIEEFTNPTILFQLSSTQQLKRWISERQNIIQDPGSKLLMITNMVRIQHGRPNYYAGIDCLNLFREQVPKIPSVFYVGNIESALNNLKSKEVDQSNLIVTNQYQQLATFISEHMHVKFKNLFAPPQEEIMEPVEPKHHSVVSSGLQPEQKKHKSQIINPKKQSKSFCNIM